MAIGYNGQPTFFPLPQEAYDECLGIVRQAQTAWVGMVSQFAAENIAMGITQAGMTLAVSDALQEVNMYGSTGSLWQAYAALSKVVVTPGMAPFLTAARIEWMRNQLVQAISGLH